MCVLHICTNLYIQRQAVSESSVVLCEVVGKQQSIYDAEQQLLCF